MALSKKKSSLALSGVDIKQLRKALSLSQQDFWSGICVTQSAGSRYESGRSVPACTEILIRSLYLGQPVTEALSDVKGLRVSGKIALVKETVKPIAPLNQEKILKDLKKRLGIA